MNTIKAACFYSSLANDIHASNVTAGWWTDINTGESTLLTRNRPEMLMLAVSELAEAGEGALGVMDDKLTHLPMYDVELADFAIRQFDQIGAEVSAGSTMPDWQHLATWETDMNSALPHVSQLRAMSRLERLMQMAMTVSAAMEHYRKGRVPNYVCTMAESVLLAFAVAKIDGINLFDVIAQKRAFNVTRPDHSVAARRAAGGKAF